MSQIEEVWGGNSRNRIPKPKLPYGFERKQQNTLDGDQRNFGELINIKD
jgi:hypothetical protein